MMLGNEPVWQGEKIIGKTTSAAFGHRLNAQVAIAQVNSEIPVTSSTSISVQVDVAGKRVPAKACATPFFDSDGLRVTGNTSS